MEVDETDVGGKSRKIDIVNMTDYGIILSRCYCFLEFINKGRNSVNRLLLMAIKCYIGSHGTTVSICERILRSGFNSGGGLAGNGVYFWVEGPLYLKLAKEWYIHKNSMGTRNAEMSECGVIIAKIKADESEYLNMETIEMTNLIHNLCRKLRIDENNKAQKERLYNMAVKDVEKELGKVFKALIIRLPSPQYSTYRNKITGNPWCCVVRVTDCIHIIACHKCEEIGDE
ncbi:MAG: hypothetical protein HQL05_06010 [Nitrospirae bacterium]|uniref:hypothetical protein n=1 Tax=Candidatus Magnetobacterium casense TaxID=1455061 RepID=UPI0012DD39D9|nr:hypothetical protein [Candidatus Magnetobacterium casensis]MBF0337369.1 hypothetical protein [Nitrospirota bacterium]